MKKTKGSISVYLLLLFSVLLLLAGAFFYSLRVQGALVQVQAGTRAALYSVFARYDRELWQSYDLLFLNGACGTDGFAPGVLAEQLKHTCGIPWGTDGEGVTASNIWRLGEPSITLTGYTLATDQAGEPFYREAVLAAEGSMTAQALAELQGYVLKEDELEKKSQNVASVETILDEVDEEKENAAADVLLGDELEEILDPEQTAVEKKKNPLETIRKVQKLGFLAVVLPEGGEISGSKYPVSALPSGRSLNSGMGLREAALPHTALDRLYFIRYMSGHFTCYTDQDREKQISCGLEYLLQGKNSDKENLERTVKKLLLLREASNLIFLEKDTSSRKAARAAALALCSAFGMPSAEELLTQAMLICWAYGESIMDVRALLAGGKVPLVKTSDTWNLTLEQLSDTEKLLNGEASGNKKGLTYRQYLEIMLYAGAEHTQILRSMDLIETELRRMEGKGSFRMDNCIYELQIRTEVPLAGAKAVTVTEGRTYAD